MIKYSNYCSKLLLQKCETISTFEEVEITKKLSFRCAQGHVNTLSMTSLSNKFSAVERKITPNICSKCVVKPSVEEQKVKEACERLGFKFVNFEKRNVVYICVCGSERKTTAQNILRKERTPTCINCFQIKNRTKYDTVKLFFEKEKCRLLETSYVNKDTQMRYECSCGNESTITYRDFKRGRKCMECSRERSEETCLIKYNVKNVSQVEEFKEKARQTFMTNYGVPHPMMNSEILEKTKETVRQKYGVSFSFCQDWVYEKIKITMKERYGVEYGTQSEEIKNRIKAVFKKKYGVEYPFLLPSIRKKCDDTCMERYGNVKFIASEQGKKMMVEKYGAECYLNSEKYKKEMLEKYGCEHAMHCPELFRKMVRSSFSRKRYVFPSGREEFVMGYEHHALDILLNHENTNKGVLSKQYEESDIIVDTEKIPIISYVYDGKKKVYYSDVFIPKRNTLIEVKSFYIYNNHRQKNHAKFLATSALYNLELWIIEKKKLVCVIYYSNGKASYNDKEFNGEEIGIEGKLKIRTKEKTILQMEEICDTFEDEFTA